MVKILYIHGFASSENSFKAIETEKYFKKFEVEVIHPTVPVEPFKAVEYLKKLDKTFDFQMVIGSSLGGFYALFLADDRKKIVLLNPAVVPSEVLTDYEGIVKRHYSEDFFYWKKEFNDQLKHLENELYSKSDLDQKKLYFFIAKDDELLNPNLAEQKFPKGNFYYQETGGHVLTNYSDLLSEIHKILTDK